MTRLSNVSGSRPRALFLSPEAPYPAVGGGPLRTASLLQYLCGHFEVDLFVFRQPAAPDPAAAVPRDLVRRTVVFDLPQHSRSTLARIRRNAIRLAKGMPPLMDRFAGFELALARAMEGRGYELAVVEHFWCAAYAGLLSRSAERVVLNLHNVESILQARSAREEGGLRAWALKRFASRSRQFEQRLLPRFDLLLASSPADRDLLLKRAPGVDVLVYPNAIPERPLPRREQRHSIVFTGNMDYHPNRLATRWFHRQIWPLIRRKHPTLRWQLMGMNPDAALEEVSGSPQVEVAGPMEDAVDSIAGARAAVVPVLAGSGTRFKIIEAWAAGVPVVSTAIGAEGLPGQDGEHLLIADSAADFAAAVDRLLCDPELASSLAARGRELYESKLTWPMAWRCLEHSLLAGSPILKVE